MRRGWYITGYDLSGKFEVAYAHVASIWWNLDAMTETFQPGAWLHKSKEDAKFWIKIAKAEAKEQHVDPWSVVVDYWG